MLVWMLRFFCMSSKKGGRRRSDYCRNSKGISQKPIQADVPIFQKPLLSSGYWTEVQSAQNPPDPLFSAGWSRVKSTVHNTKQRVDRQPLYTVQLLTGSLLDIGCQQKKAIEPAGEASETLSLLSNASNQRATISFHLGNFLNLFASLLFTHLHPTSAGLSFLRASDLPLLVLTLLLLIGAMVKVQLRLVETRRTGTTTAEIRVHTCIRPPTFSSLPMVRIWLLGHRILPKHSHRFGYRLPRRPRGGVLDHPVFWLATLPHPTASRKFHRCSQTTATFALFRGRTPSQRQNRGPSEAEVAIPAHVARENRLIRQGEESRRPT